MFDNGSWQQFYALWNKKLFSKLLIENIFLELGIKMGGFLEQFLGVFNCFF